MILSPNLINRLQELSFEHVYVKDELTSPILADDIISVSVLNYALKMIEQCYVQVASALAARPKDLDDLIKMILENDHLLEAIPVTELKIVTRRIIEDIESAGIQQFTNCKQYPPLVVIPNQRVSQ